MSGTDALVLKGLRKVFARPAVDDLDLAIHAGELYALLGPNGAGKTTTLRMVAGLLKPDAGSISVFGVAARADALRQAHPDRISAVRRRAVGRRPQGRLHPLRGAAALA